MRTPSIERLMSTFKIEKETAKLIKKIGRYHSESSTDLDNLQELIMTDPRLEKTARYARSCYSSPWITRGWRTTMALDALSLLLPGVYGVESLRKKDDNPKGWPPFEYLNAGNPCAMTLIYSRKDHADNLFIGSWGEVASSLVSSGW